MPKDDKEPLGERLLRLLLAVGDSDVSGELLSQQLGVTRAAVWKEIERLRAEGYGVSSATKRGYRLTSLPDRMTPALIEPWIGAKSPNRLYCLDEVDSTILEANRLILSGAESGTVVLAEHQTAGMGRMGRSFASLAGQGVYLSMILTPQCDARQLGLLTSYAGLAVLGAIRKLCGTVPQIKWPNDIIMNGRKVCGILTRLVSDAETNTITHAIVGIGINVTQRTFPDELRDKAISIWQATGQVVPRAQLTGLVIAGLNQMVEENWLQAPPTEVLQELRVSSCTIGSTVLVRSPTDSRTGAAVGIDDSGALLVRFGDRVETVSSGEVSVRGLLGYLPDAGTETEE